MNYFVTVDGEDIKSNLTKKQAIKIANEKYKEIKSTLRIGIGNFKYKKGKKMYVIFPMHFYIT